MCMYVRMCMEVSFFLRVCLYMSPFVTMKERKNNILLRSNFIYLINPMELRNN